MSFMIAIEHFLEDRRIMTSFHNLHIFRLTLQKTTFMQLHACISPFPAIRELILTLRTPCEADDPLPATPLAPHLRKYKGPACLLPLMLLQTAPHALTMLPREPVHKLLHALRTAGAAARPSVTYLSLRVTHTEICDEAKTVLTNVLAVFPRLAALHMDMLYEEQPAAAIDFNQFCTRLAQKLSVATVLESLELRWPRTIDNVVIPRVAQLRAALFPSPKRSIQEAVERVANFLLPGNVAILTGAGVSVDSGIRAYRGNDGRYMNPNYKPLFYHQLMDESEAGHAFRQRYWLRSYLGWPAIRDTLPNPTHFGLAALQYARVAPKLITQNVDASSSCMEACTTSTANTGTSWTAQPSRPGSPPPTRSGKHSQTRPSGQANKPRTNPDGDVAIEHLGTSYTSFIVPECPSCLLEDRINSVHKPEVIFFGESIPPPVRDQSFHDVEEADRLLVIGTTLATYSAFRLLKRAVELGKPVLLLNVGPSRGDGIEEIERIDMASGLIIRDVVRAVLGTAVSDPVVAKMLQSGIVKPPEDDSDTRPAEVASK
ncbi:NAD-dependent deacetylase [Mycena venus]|uniref:NAD-dependent deacetylase n=1 Tax=Mycena venus TaxID=2733690 RepID=A0A8H6YDG9_9AGAR|nr:NAD-dependent deacetylase [Mycena venus]